MVLGTRTTAHTHGRFLILEHAPNGELFDYLVQKGALDANEALRLFQQIVEGLAYCHSYYIWCAL